MFYVSRGGGGGGGGYEKVFWWFLDLNQLPATDLKCLIRNFNQIAFKQCPTLLAIPMIWNHLVGKLVLPL